jgi:IclR family acetate operon transcriptional repressor
MSFRSLKSLSGSRSTRDPDSSALRAFALLELIANSDRAPSLDDLTRASALPKPTVYRILGLLTRSGLVQRDPFEKRYLLGPRVSALSLAVQMHSPLRGARRAILTRVVDKIGETCNFTMLDGSEVVYVERVETSESVRLHMKAGSRVPLHCTASGKLFLAHLTPAQMHALLGPEPFRRYTERTITSMSVLERELRKIRSTGVATDSGEYLVGSVCLAVPVLDSRARVCAAIAVHGPAPRMTLKRGYSFVPALKRAAAALSETREQSVEHGALAAVAQTAATATAEVADKVLAVPQTLV